MTKAMKLQLDDGPRSSLGIGPGSDDVVGSHRSSLGDSPKGSGSLLGTRREIVGRRPEDSPQECQRLPDWQDGGCTAVAQVVGWLTRSDWAVESPVPRNLGALAVDPPRTGG
ncbi:hypothetical protein BHM03_00043060 [Ensete ventricosum]|nr:hypothetical protein BHM03_00043060 [Ensete ventricosum]